MFTEKFSMWMRKDVCEGLLVVLSVNAAVVHISKTAFCIDRNSEKWPNFRSFTQTSFSFPTSLPNVDRSTTVFKLRLNFTLVNRFIDLSGAAHGGSSVCCYVFSRLGFRKVEWLCLENAGLSVDSQPGSARGFLYKMKLIILCHLVHASTLVHTSTLEPIFV